MKAYNFPETDTPVKWQKVAVIGRLAAMDSARCALRMGAEEVAIYRRSEQEMPARKEEAEHAKKKA